MIKKKLYGKTQRFGNQEKVIITEKYDGSNLTIFKCDDVIEKQKEINNLKTELKQERSKNFEQAMMIEGYENKLSKFHISNLEQVGLEKKEK